MDYKKYFKGKKITLMGLGLLGRGIGDAKFLADNDADLTITDLKTADELKPSLKKLEKYKNIKYILGRHRLVDFKNKDFILKSAGVPLDSKFIRYARENNIPIEMDESLFAKLSSVQIIGVTGTRGKSTVTTLIFEILKSIENKLNGKVYLGGNIKGVATLPLLKKIKRDDIVVMELSSWQLQGFGVSKISPHISVFTNFFDDHLNYYKNNRTKYFRDKSNIFEFQTESDYLITTFQARQSIREYFDNKIKSKQILARGKDFPNSWRTNLPGEHNRENIALAAKVAELLGVSKNATKKSVGKIKAIEGRMEYLRTYRGIKIYNDNNATSPEATILALRAFGKKNIVLIMGGSSKGLDMSNLVREIKNKCKTVILFKEKGTDEIKNEILAYKKINSFEEDGLKNCVDKAVEVSKKGDVLLLSPAFASFGKYFKNEFDRGDQFCRLIKKLK